MKENKLKKAFLVILIVCTFLTVKQLQAAETTTPAAVTPNPVFAVSSEFKYTLLEGLPGFFNAGGVMTDFPALVLAIYKFGIWTIGISGLFMITIGGIMYAGSAGNTSTAGKANEIIIDALIGIAAAMISYLFLYVINPDLTQMNINFTPVNVDEPAETSKESAGTLQGGIAGTCRGLATQSGIASQCSTVSSQLAGLLNCVALKLPSTIINSISDSRGYVNCIPSAWIASCAHAKYSCHYGGKTCYNSGKSYAVDFSTRNLNVNQLILVSKACGASYVKDESGSASHIHVSVGQIAGCGCN